MENPFFTAIEGGGFKSFELARQTNEVLMPFRHYLDNSIKALENKEVSCEWLPVADQRYRLTPQQRIWRLIPSSEIELINDQAGWYQITAIDGELPNSDFDPNETDPVLQGKGKGRRENILPEDGYKAAPDYHLYLPDMILDEEPLSWSGYQLEIRPLTVALEAVKSVHIDGHVCKVMAQQEAKLTLQGHVEANSSLSINGQDTRFKLLKAFDESTLKSFVVKKEGQGWLVFAEKKPALHVGQLEDITNTYLSQLSVSHFQYNGKQFDPEFWSFSIEKEGVVLESKENRGFTTLHQITCSSLSEVTWQVDSIEIKEKWIQLIEKESSDDTGKSDLDYFFTDNKTIKILDSTQRKNDEGFRVIKVRPDERQILLARNQKGKKNNDSVYPASKEGNREIRVSVDTSQLRRQKEALNQLMSRPSVGHWPLIHLLQKRDLARWPTITPIREQLIDWRVLTDPNFDGCDRQRNFVAKALAMEDFTILDGPPGTGKTTTILELIYQLVAKGKRVLLSASTHAAINNVLERIKDSEVLNQTIHALRIGDESNAIGVEEYQFDNLYNNFKEIAGLEGVSKQLVVDSSNLVCGTTIGILRLFNDREIALELGEPPFDVMIIDECSKTTFQEFLVPARFAKRWVLVGDVRQLSPFTDREQIVANLDNLMLVPPRGEKPAKTLPKAVQQACFLLEELRGTTQHDQTPYQQPLLVPVTMDVLSALQQEIKARKVLHHLSTGLSNILLISQDTRQHGLDWVKNVQIVKQEPWLLYRFNLCFIDESLLSEFQPLIPDDMIVLHPHWQRTQQAAHHKFKGTSTKAFKIKNIDFHDSAEIQKELLERLYHSSWSEEVCWRLEREYWLRLSANKAKKTGYLEKALERLFPKSIDADGRIHVLKNIAFPSILEALSGDGLEKRKKDNPTTLNQGFSKLEKQQRYTTLTYQHRMHPNISKFPRSQFYPEGVLVDGSKTTTDRNWQYSRYLARNIWLNIEGETQRGNSNRSEVKAITLELKAFCEWAEGKYKNKKNESFDVAILTFYKGQEKALREAFQKELPGNNSRYARFNYKGIAIKLATVDYFQGQEADVVFLSMVNTQRDGFMDSPNRLNVAITRARFQLVLVGHYEYFNSRSRTEELKNLAKACQLIQLDNKAHRIR